MNRECKGWTLNHHAENLADGYDREWYEKLDQTLYEDTESALMALEKQLNEMGHSLEEMEWEEGPCSGPNGEAPSYGWLPNGDGLDRWYLTPLYTE